MMSMTHISIGLATAVAISNPKDFKSYLPVIAGAAIGSIICDIDCRSTKEMRDALYGRIVSGVIFIVALLIDVIFKGKMISFVIKNKNMFMVGAAIVFLVVGAIAYNTKHRTFSHSFLALFLYSICIGILCLPLLIPFILGFLTHILLDILNKKEVMIFFPSEKGYCLSWFYANKVADKVFLVVGIASLIGIIALRTIV